MAQIHLFIFVYNLHGLPFQPGGPTGRREDTSLIGSTTGSVRRIRHELTGIPAWAPFRLMNEIHSPFIILTPSSCEIGDIVRWVGSGLCPLVTTNPEKGFAFSAWSVIGRFLAKVRNFTQTTQGLKPPRMTSSSPDGLVQQSFQVDQSVSPTLCPGAFSVANSFQGSGSMEVNYLARNTPNFRGFSR